MQYDIEANTADLKAAVAASERHLAARLDTGLAALRALDERLNGLPALPSLHGMPAPPAKASRPRARRVPIIPPSATRATRMKSRADLPPPSANRRGGGAYHRRAALAARDRRNVAVADAANAAALARALAPAAAPALDVTGRDCATDAAAGEEDAAALPHPPAMLPPPTPTPRTRTAAEARLSAQSADSFATAPSSPIPPPDPVREMPSGAAQDVGAASPPSTQLATEVPVPPKTRGGGTAQRVSHAPVVRANDGSLPQSAGAKPKASAVARAGRAEGRPVGAAAQPGSPTGSPVPPAREPAPSRAARSRDPPATRETGAVPAGLAVTGEDSSLKGQAGECPSEDPAAGIEAGVDALADPDAQPDGDAALAEESREEAVPAAPPARRLPSRRAKAEHVTYCESALAAAANKGRPRTMRATAVDTTPAPLVKPTSRARAGRTGTAAGRATPSAQSGPPSSPNRLQESTGGDHGMVDARAAIADEGVPKEATAAHVPSERPGPIPQRQRRLRGARPDVEDDGQELATRGNGANSEAVAVTVSGESDVVSAPEPEAAMPTGPPRADGDGAGATDGAKAEVGRTELELRAAEVCTAPAARRRPIRRGKAEPIAHDCSAVAVADKRGRARTRAPAVFATPALPTTRTTRARAAQASSRDQPATSVASLADAGHESAERLPDHALEAHVDDARERGGMGNAGAAAAANFLAGEGGGVEGTDEGEDEEDAPIVRGRRNGRPVLSEASAERSAPTCRRHRRLRRAAPEVRDGADEADKVARDVPPAEEEAEAEAVETADEPVESRTPPAGTDDCGTSNSQDVPEEGTAEETVGTRRTRSHRIAAATAEPGAKPKPRAKARAKARPTKARRARPHANSNAKAAGEDVGGAAAPPTLDFHDGGALIDAARVKPLSASAPVPLSPGADAAPAGQGHNVAPLAEDAPVSAVEVGTVDEPECVPSAPSAVQRTAAPKLAIEAATNLHHNKPDTNKRAYRSTMDSEPGAPAGPDVEQQLDMFDAAADVDGRDNAADKSPAPKKGRPSLQPPSSDPAERALVAAAGPSAPARCSRPSTDKELLVAVADEAMPPPPTPPTIQARKLEAAGADTLMPPPPPPPRSSIVQPSLAGQSSTLVQTPVAGDKSSHFALPARPVHLPSINRFKVDGKGKVSSVGLGVLSEICTTPLAKAPVPAGNSSSAALRPSSVRSSRLFAAPGDIYSSTRKPAHARIRPVNSSALKSSSLLIAKTPGVRAPVKSHSVLDGLNGSVSTGSNDVSVESVVVPMPRLTIGGRTGTTAPLPLGPTSAKSSEDGDERKLESAAPPVPPLAARGDAASDLSGQEDSNRPAGAALPAPAPPLEPADGQEAKKSLSTTAQPAGGDEGMRKRSIEDLYKTAPSKTGKRPRIAFAEEPGHGVGSGAAGPGEVAREPKTAPLKNARRPRIVTAKSALRARIEGRTAQQDSDSVALGSLSSGTASTPRHAGKSSLSSVGTDGTAHLSLSTAFGSGPASGFPSASESVLSTTRARVAPGPTGMPAGSAADGGEQHDFSSKAPSPPDGSAVAHATPPRACAARETECPPPGAAGPSFLPDAKEKGPGKGADGGSQLGNLMTSISSFLPSFRPRKDVADEESAEERAAAAQAVADADARHRASELVRRREAARIAKQKEAEEKQRRAEGKRELMAKAEQHREEERRRKEAERSRKLKEAEEMRKRQKEEEDRRRELKRRRVEEQQKKLAAQEAERRRALEEKARAHRERLKRAKGAAGTAGGGTAAGTAGGGTAAGSLIKAGAAGSSAVAGAMPARPPPPESYEMSATKEGNGEDSSDSETEQMRRAKQIPTWARSANLPQSLVAETRDPDSIFDKVNTINLEEVFEGHPTKRRFRARTSSGMWVRDRLTAREELDYKKMTTGFDASMPPPPPPPPPPPSGSGGAGASGV